MGTEAAGWAFRQDVGDPYAKLILIGLADCYSDKTGECFPSCATLMEFAGCSERSVKEKIAYLEREGWIKRIPRYDAKGRQTSNAYEIVFARGVTRDEWIVQQAERRKKVAKPTRQVGCTTCTPTAGEGAPAAPRRVRQLHPRGCATCTPLTKKNEQDALARENVDDVKGSGVCPDIPAEPQAQDMRDRVGPLMRDLAKTMSVNRRKTWPER